MRGGRKRVGAGGFTLIEAMIYLVFGGLVVGAIHFSVLTNQREFVEQRATAAVQGSLRNALMALVQELRTISPKGGDLTQIDPQEIGFRSIEGSGTVCAAVAGAGDPTYALAFMGGGFRAEAPDSALVLAIRGPGLADDEWRPMKITAATEVKGKTAPTCGWPGTKEKSKLTIGVAGDTSGVRIGSSIRAFRNRSFGLFQDDGSWWLGRRSAGSGWEKLAGPLLTAADSGLVFRYLRPNGTPTSNASEVASVEILMRAMRPGVRPREESLATTVALRG